MKIAEEKKEINDLYCKIAESELEAKQWMVQIEEKQVKNEKLQEMKAEAKKVVAFFQKLLEQEKLSN